MDEILEALAAGPLLAAAWHLGMCRALTAWADFLVDLSDD
ncbi:hypothetical protein BGLT_02242 [Caballeronia glathei]|nr:hypothetical protein BGLT_02242 [Caballeronia glathei]